MATALEQVPAPFVVTPNRVTLSRTGADLAPDLTFDEYLEIGERLSDVSEAWQWWWGDFLNEGEHRFGEKYAQALPATGKATGTLMNAASVAGRIPISRRRENLSFSHHAVVAYLDEDVQEKLLDQAEAKEMSVADLRQYASTFRKALKNGGELPPEKKKDPPQQPTEPAPAEPADTTTPADYGEDTPEMDVDLVAELQAANDRIEELETQIESLLADDQKAENHKLLVRIQGLEGRLAGAIAERNESARQIKYYQALTRNIREALGVEQNNEILPKIES